MTFVEMKSYIDKCLKVYSDSISMLVLTGGECTLLNEDLFSIIRYASSLNLKIRIVTNGWWAISYRKAYSFLKELKDSGLNEINFSTGDEHQEWIPFKKIRDASIAAVRLGLICVINIETHDNSSFDFNKILSKDKMLQKYCNIKEKGINRILVEKGIWIPVKKTDFEKITYEKYPPNNKYRCESILGMIDINPYGEMLACCGLTSEQNPFLRLGNVNKHNIKELYESSFKDLLKIWLYTEGPEAILRYISIKKGVERNIYPRHVCAACRELFSDKENIAIIQENFIEISNKVLLKYFLATK